MRLNTTTWIPIHYLFLIVFIVVISQQRAIWHIIAVKKRAKRGVAGMTNEILKKYIGKNCHISTGPFGTSIVGIISDINENWLEVKTKKDIQLINAEFIQSIRVVNR